MISCGTDTWTDRHTNYIQNESPLYPIQAQSDIFSTLFFPPLTKCFVWINDFLRLIHLMVNSTLRSIRVPQITRITLTFLRVIVATTTVNSVGTMMLGTFWWRTDWIKITQKNLCKKQQQKKNAKVQICKTWLRRIWRSWREWNRSKTEFFSNAAILKSWRREREGWRDAGQLKQILRKNAYAYNHTAARLRQKWRKIDRNETVWPDWAKFCHFGKNQKSLGHLSKVYLAFS